MRTPWWRATSASRSPWAAAARSRLAPIVSPSNGVSDVPCAYERVAKIDSSAGRATLPQAPAMCKWSRPRGGNLPGESQARVADQAPTPDRRPSDRALADVDEVTDSALGYLSLEALLGELLERITAAIETDTAAILLLDESRGVLVARAAKGIEEEVRRGVTIPVGAGFAGRIAEQREPLAIPDVDH